MKKPKSLFGESRRNKCVNKLAGEWVAFANGKIVAHEGTLKKLMKKVKKFKGNQKTSIMLMPKRMEGNFII
jgi:N-acetylneuraminic acid mutarotase